MATGFTATFTDSTGGVSTFLVYDQGFRDALVSTLEEWTLPILVPDSATWGLLNTQRTPKELVTVNVIAAQAANPPQVVVDIGGGMGQGTISVPNLDNHSAILIGLDRTMLFQDGSCLATANFLITG